MASPAVFTAHERNELRSTWGSKQTRLTRESFLPFGSCNLCLLQARDPVSCPSHGHLFCRECALSNLLSQGQALKRLKKEAEQKKVQEDESRHLQDAENQARDLEDFERLQAGLISREDSAARSGQMIGNKRKHEDDDERDSKRGASHTDMERSDKRHAMCPVDTDNAPHKLSMKSLITVKFNDQDKERSCPSCDRALTNTTKAVLAKPCGHVLCKACSEKFQQAEASNEMRCYVCQEKLALDSSSKHKDKENRGLTELKSDGTGFAGGGKNMVKKSGLAFQC